MTNKKGTRRERKPKGDNTDNKKGDKKEHKANRRETRQTQ